MDLKSFYQSYDLNEIEILKIYSKDRNLYILLSLEAKLDLIANGCRPTFDLFYKHMFIFKNVNININIKNPKVTSYIYKDGSIYLTINKKEIVITQCDIEVIENYEA